ncbi:SOS response-associated peptidase [Fictibacillus sp. KIGAM418]|uniref:Abasic site processing protein n=1 Tax=Fictibacillus marinisediminis TaxID=2878389 RepID=A0A9X1XG37_9BACL|nr:SOS response-associated peptidase [Fictibacillus marinisediminis]MCK6258420.1 SOS response-associated peptidase [Fictibacillus marinisediminis]
MCGRYSLYADMHFIQEEFDITIPKTLPQRFNIAPSQNVLVITSDRGTRKAEMHRWGLIPFWAKDPKIGYKMINARAETVDEKASFRGPLKNKRCLVIADGFFEWKREDKQKQPFHIRLKNRKPFAFAGLWDQWEQNGEVITSCTHITTRPNALMKDLHDRMPVILTKEAEESWLDPSIQDNEYLKSLLTPYDSEQMEAFEVSPVVNSPRNDVKDCVVPLYNF